MFKNLLIICLLSFVSFSAFAQKGTIQGTVKDISNEPLIGANVIIYDAHNNVIKGEIADIEGNYSMKVPISSYTLKVLYIGYETFSKEIEVKEGETLTVDIVLKEDRASLSEVAVMSSKRSKRSKRSERSRESTTTVISSKSNSYHQPAATGATGANGATWTQSKNAKVVTKPASSQTTPQPKVVTTPMTTKERFKRNLPPLGNVAYDINDEIAEVEEQALPEAGQLTAGEVNDFSKWELWDDLSQEALRAYQDTWYINPEDRYTLQLTSEAGSPIVDATVELVYKNERYWTAKTDNTGKAELWLNLYGKEVSNLDKLSMVVSYQGSTNTLKKITPFKKGINHLQLEKPCEYPNQIDIAFVVDATGSMKDELDYLKSELGDIIEQVQREKSEENIRLGSVFYKSVGDDYVTTKSDFSENIAKTTDFIKDKRTGGGRSAEAVETALEVAVNELSWSENATTRLLFLVLDEPPANTTDIVERLHKVNQQAAAKGVRIIPVACSGTDKSTEYLMRTLALSTNGTYVFLTDDSGIGESHIKPTTDTFEVEYLNGLLVRLIKQFSELPDCKSVEDVEAIVINEEKENQAKDNPQILEKINIKCYPNPSDGIVNIDIPKKIEELFVTDATGKILIRKTNLKKRKETIDLSQFPTGMYLVRCQIKEQIISERIMIVH